MPMYEYRCVDCGYVYEELRRMSDADDHLKCPECGSEQVNRLMSGFAMSGCRSTPGGGFS
jgi:putative FmdB family regulatory protein